MLAWPAWMSDTRCLRVICVGLLGVCVPTPLAVLAAVWIVGDCVYGRVTNPGKEAT